MSLFKKFTIPALPIDPEAEARIDKLLAENRRPTQSRPLKAKPKVLRLDDLLEKLGPIPDTLICLDFETFYGDDYTLPTEWLETFAHRIAVQPSGCWLWTGTITGGGYGQLRFNGKLEIASRVSWTLAHGSIPSGPGWHGISVCHKCDVRACVHPFHLFLGTHQENMADMARKGRTTPSKGTKHGCAELNDADVVEIRRRREMGETQTSLARAFGVSQAQVWRILHRLAWRHIP